MANHYIDADAITNSSINIAINGNINDCFPLHTYYNYFISHNINHYSYNLATIKLHSHIMVVDGRFIVDCFAINIIGVNMVNATKNVNHNFMILRGC